MRIKERPILISVLLPALLLGGLAMLFFNKMALSNLILARGDTFLYFYPYWHAAAAALADGRVPFWNPAVFMGAPLLANSQAGFFYPFNWPFWLLLETPYAASASIILHVLIAAFGTYLVGRRVLSLSRSGALVAAASFAFGGYLTAQVEHINQLQGLSWLPWFFLAAALAARGTRRAWLLSTLATAALFALQLLAGHTQTTFITAVALLVWLLAGVIGSRFLPNSRPAGKPQQTRVLFSPFAALLAGGLLAVGLAAIQLLPTLELMRYSSREGGLLPNEVMSFSLPPQLLAHSMLPLYGQSLFTEYVAFLPLVILALAFIGGWQWRIREGVFPALTLSLTGLFLSLGAYNPLYWLLARLPGFSFFRAPARWLVLAALGLSLLAGIGWHLLWQWAGDGCGEQERKQFFRRRIIPPLLLFFAALLLLAIWAFAGGYVSEFVPLGPESPYERPSFLTVGGWLLEALLLVALLAAAAYLDNPRFRRLALTVLLLVGLAAAFFASRDLPYNNLTTPEAFFDLRPSTSRLLSEGGEPPDRMLSLSNIFFDPGDQAEIDTVYAGQLSEQARYDYTIAVKQKEINAPNLPMIYGLASVDGFDGGILPLRSYSQLMSVILPDGQQTSDGRLREHLDAVPEARWLDLFNARHLITDKTGDVWRDGVFFDRQHPTILGEGKGVAVAFLPEYEATEIRLLASAAPETIQIETRDGDSWSLTPELAEESLYRAVFPRPALLDELLINACGGGSCMLEGLTLVDTRDDTFYALTPGSYRLIHSGDVKIYENLDVLPRAYLSFDWQWVADTQAAVALMSDPDFDPRRTAVLVSGENAPQSRDNQPASGAQGQTEIIRYNSDEVVIQTNTPVDALLILTDATYPGWQAAIDGEPAPITQANGLFRGVFVPEGEHEIVFNFDSAAYRIGLIGFILTIGILALLLGWLLLDYHKNS